MQIGVLLQNAGVITSQYSTEQILFDDSHRQEFLSGLAGSGASSELGVILDSVGTSFGYGADVVDR